MKTIFEQTYEEIKNEEVCDDTDNPIANDVLKFRYMVYTKSIINGNRNFNRRGFKSQICLCN